MSATVVPVRDLRQPRRLAPMRVCLMIEGQEGVTWEEWVALARACELHGLEGLFRSDHYGSILSEPWTDAHDSWATITALAVLTERIRLGTMVSPVTFRHPAVVARMVVTADHVSGGRVELGLGAGWYEAEHVAHGFPFPPLRERFAKLEADAEAIVRSWTDDDRAQPKPVQTPHPPIVVGGSAKSRGARLAARFAQEYNTTSATLEQVGERRAALDAACHSAGRDPASLPLSLMTGCLIGRTADEVRERGARVQRLVRAGGDLEAWLAKSANTWVIGTVEEAAERLRALEAAGVTRVMLQHLDHRDLDAVELMGRELAPAVA
jgi:alkanesulfonate monooxygenase SsuD/methylene tetrahydromethanopterin reductase-like flavin-dependent oxidoreductase (luciferase family)